MGIFHIVAFAFYHYFVRVTGNCGYNRKRLIRTRLHSVYTHAELMPSLKSLYQVSLLY